MFIIRGTKHTELIHLGIASILIGSWLLSENSLNLVLIDMPILWVYTAYFSIQLLLPCFCIFMKCLFGDTKHQILKRLAYAFSLCFLVNFILDVLNIVSWSVTIRAFHLLLVIGIAGMVKAVISKFKIDIRARLFAFGFIVLSLAGICDMINRFYIPIPFLLHHRVTQWGMFFFIITLLYILGLNLTSVFDRLKVYSKEIEDKNMSLRAMWSELRESRDKIAEWNISLEQIIKQKTFAIKSLLNNADQGFLTFGRDIVIDEEPSKECTDIFGREVTGAKFVELFEMHDEERKYLELMLTKIFDEKSANKRGILIPLLPSEYYVNSKYVTSRYKMIENGHEEIMMVIFTDITEKKCLENKIEDERNALRMVVTAVTSHFELSKAIKRYNDFCRKEMHEILDGSQPTSEKISEIYRTVHTFKSIFAQLDMVNVVKKLHEFEDNIYELKNSASNKSSEEIISLFKNSGMSDWLDDDICLLKETLGENFFEHKKIMIVDTTKLIELESKISTVLTNEQ
ncbi:MAG TPA: 7TM diverse intracellular signaling domain-containing protein, partial [Clostridia bacterium]